METGCGLGGLGSRGLRRGRHRSCRIVGEGLPGDAAISLSCAAQGCRHRQHYPTPTMDRPPGLFAREEGPV